MTQDPNQILSYGTPASRPSRFRHVRAILPFGGGWLMGAMLSRLVLTLAPDFLVSDAMEVLVIPIYLVLPIVYVLVILLLIGCFSSRSLAQGQPLISGLIGFAIPLMGAATTVMQKTIDVVLSPPSWLQGSLGWTVLILMAVVIHSAPFFLVRWREPQPSVEMTWLRIRSIFLKAAAAVVLLLVLLATGKWAAEKKYDQDCIEVAAWVKRNHPTPGAYLSLALPAVQHLLTPDQRVDALVLPDGRVILLLMTSLGWHHNWSGIIYASGPIKASEIGVDAYGRPQLRIDGLQEHFVEKQVDSQHFVVAFDLG